MIFSAYRIGGLSIDALLSFKISVPFDQLPFDRELFTSTEV
jgi:hypothetical protein